MRALPGQLCDVAPVFVAPMAGGASTADLVIAAAQAGHFAQLAAGYKTVAAIREQIERVRAAGVTLFGVNLRAKRHPGRPCRVCQLPREAAGRG
jgi:NAD(P)H-dependent flavin oxidoreductase YrpB (nitropropane dioxygenase family)